MLAAQLCLLSLLDIVPKEDSASPALLSTSFVSSIVAYDDDVTQGTHPSQQAHLRATFTLSRL